MNLSGEGAAYLGEVLVGVAEVVVEAQAQLVAPIEPIV
jgi:hypothetical protein